MNSSKINAGIIFLTLIFSYFAICHPALLGRIYASLDVEQTMIPTRVFYSIALENNEPGLWNPFLFRGYDHLGVAETGSYHPGHFILYRFFPTHLGIIIESLIIFPIAGMGMYLLLSRFCGLSRLSALFGAGIFIHSTFFMAHFGQVHMVWIYGHLPWVLIAIEQCFRGRQQYRGSAFLGLLYGSMFLLEHPQVTLLVSIPAAAAIISRSLTIEPHRLRYRGVALALIGISAGLMIGMLKLIPSVIALAATDRGNLSVIQRNNFSLHPLQLLSNFSPALFKDKIIGDWFYVNATTRVYINNISEGSAYFGIALITLVFCGLVVFAGDLFARKNRVVSILFTGVLIVCGLLMLGRYGCLNDLLKDIPLISQIRSPNRYKSVIAFGLSLIAALIFHLLDTRVHKSLSRRQWLLLGIPFAATLLVWVTATMLGSLKFRGQTIAFNNVSSLSLGPILCALTSWLFILALRHRPYARTGLAVICVLDLALYGLPIIQDVPFKTFNDVQEARSKMMTQDKMFRRIALNNKPLWDGYYLANGYMGMVPKEPLDYSRYDHLRLASISHAYVSDHQTHPIHDPLPRIRLARSLRQVDNPLEQTDQINLNDTVLAEPGIGEEISGPPVSNEEYVEILKDGYQSLKFRVTTNYKRILVISDYWNSGWKAAIDGRDTTVLPLFSGAIRGVILTAGIHTVEMTYRPDYLPKARRICFFGLFIISVLLLIDLIRPREDSLSARPC